MRASDTGPLLTQLLWIKQCRETALRNRLRRLDLAVQQCDAACARQMEARAQVRAEWREANRQEHTVEHGAVHRIRKAYAEFYGREQQIGADLRRLASEIEDYQRETADSQAALKDNQRGQEKLKAVMREQR